MVLMDHRNVRSVQEFSCGRSPSLYEAPWNNNGSGDLTLYELLSPRASSNILKDLLAFYRFFFSDSFDLITKNLY